MHLKLVLLFAVLTICLEYIFAVPRPNAVALQGRQELVQKFAEFLHEDAEFSKVLQGAEWNDEALVRNRRQSNVQGLESSEDETPREKKGFFDKAAKFVTELLQRFLKWINSAEDEKY